MSTKYYLPMAVMAMTAMSHAKTFEQDGFKASAKADVCFVQSKEEDGTDTRTTNQFLVRGNLAFSFTTENATLSIQRNFTELSSNFSSLNVRTPQDNNDDGDTTDAGETNTVALLTRDNTKTLLSVTIYSDEEFSVAAEAGDRQEGYSWVTKHENSALGYGVSVNGSGWAISLSSNTSLASAELEGNNAAEISLGDSNVAVSVKTTDLLVDGLGLQATYKDSANYLEVSGSYDVSDYTNVKGSMLNAFFVTNTDQNDENMAYGADLTTSFNLSEYVVNLGVSYTLQQQFTQGEFMSAPNRHLATTSQNDIATTGTAQPGEDLSTMVVTAGATVGGHNIMAFYGHTKLNAEEQTLMGVCLNLIG